MTNELKEFIELFKTELELNAIKMKASGDTRGGLAIDGVKLALMAVNIKLMKTKIDLGGVEAGPTDQSELNQGSSESPQDQTVPTSDASQ